MNIVKIRSGKIGDLYLIKNKIELNLLNTHNIFGIENKFKNKIIKWVINENQLDAINILESDILENMFKLLNNPDLILKSKVIKKKDYPILLETKLNLNSNEVIKHDIGDIVTYSDIQKKKKYSVELYIKNLSIKNNNIFYNFIVKKINA
jgi:hypothetical protein